MSILLNLTNKRFGKLVATGNIKRRYGQVFHQCRCDCGNINWVQTGHLTHDRTTNCGCSRKLQPGYACRNRVLDKYKRQAKARNLIWKLTDVQFINIVNKPCYFCGQSYINEQKHLHSNGSFRYNGVDRLDNTKGYTIKNSVPCCKFCNRAKGTGTAKEFFKWMNGIVRRTK